ncbi:MAG: ECF transporter S component [Candidatus Saliniplasma sp.]
MDKEHFLSTKDLVTIALLSALGGGLSTYIGYLGNLINRIVGVPFGAGQFMAGLHVIWIVLAVGITRKKGVGATTGIIKGAVELFLGSTHGVVIVVVSLIQGIIVDAVLFNDKTKEKRNPIPYMIAGGASASSNVFIFQAFFFAGVPILLILLLGMLAFGSGMIFGGYITLQMMDSLEHGGLIHRANKEFEEKETEKPLYIKYTSVIVTVMFLISFTIGGVYYFTNVYQAPGSEEIHVGGEVKNEYKFVYDDFKDQERTVRAELIGSVTHVPPKNYTGIPLNVAIENADPENGSRRIEVFATDGYSKVFNLTKILNDDDILITLNDGKFRIIAKGYDGSFWVEDVYEIKIQ